MAQSTARPPATKATRVAVSTVAVDDGEEDEEDDDEGALASPARTSRNPDVEGAIAPGRSSEKKRRKRELRGGRNETQEQSFQTEEKERKKVRAQCSWSLLAACH